MDVQRIVRTQVTTGELDPPTNLLQSINDGHTPLTEIVRSLGEFLVSEEAEARLNGLTFLTNTLKSILPSKVNRQATQTLTNFFVAKLDDSDALSPTLQALVILSKLPHFDDDAAVEVYRAVVENVNMKAHVQAIRHLVYQIIDSLLALHRRALKDMGLDFLNSYTKTIEGEKDPRNLMLLFSMDRIILLEFDVQEVIEELFDVTFCYFPISFRPPPNDPYGITADDLKLALRKCMASSPHFAKTAIPLFLEKFPTSAGPAMKDLMLTMGECLPVYGAVAVDERGKELWECVKTEILYSSDSTIEASALSALESLVRTLYPTAEDVPSGLAQTIIKECLEMMQEPEKTQALAATKMLVALVRASPSVGPYAISQAFQQLFTQFNRPNLPSHRTPILWSISSILIAARSVYGKDHAVRSQTQEKSLEPFRDSLMDILREGLRTDDLKEAAVRGAVALTEIPGFWSRADVEQIVRGIDDILINDDSPEIKPVVIKGLTAISKVHPTIVETITLPLLFHNLPDQAPLLTETEARRKYRGILHSLAKLCVQPGLFETLVIRVTNKLDTLAGSPLSPRSNRDPDGPHDQDGTIDVRECTVAYAWDLLDCLSAVVDSKIREKHADVIKQFDQIVPRVYGLSVAAAAPRLGNIEPLFRDQRLLEATGRLSETLAGELPVDKQSKHLANIYDAFERGDMSSIVHEPTKIKPLITASPLRSGASVPEQNLIVLYSSMIQGIRKDVILPFDSAADYLGSKVHWTINVARDELQIRWALGLITAFVNKRDKDLADSQEAILETIWSKDIQDTSLPLATRTRALRVYLHIVKGLAILRNSLAYPSLERIIDILTLSNLDPEFVDAAAKGLGILVGDKDRAKERQSRLTTKLLHAQKLWNFALPKLIEGDKDAEGKGRLAYLVAFSSLLPLVPASLLLTDLPTILPLVLRSLALSPAKQRLNAIIALTSVLETQNLSSEVDSLLHKSTSALVDGIGKSILPDETGALQTSGKVRAAALRCLALIPDAIRSENLQPIKRDVLRDLGKALDDPLRAVRREAVECRARWYKV